MTDTYRVEIQRYTWGHHEAGLDSPFVTGVSWQVKVFSGRCECGAEKQSGPAMTFDAFEKACAHAENVCRSHEKTATPEVK